MRWFSAIGVVAVMGASLLAGDEKERTFRFKKEDAGKVPAGWKAAKTGQGEGSVWKVVADDTAPSKSGYVLAQTAESPSNVFNICVADDTNYKDVEISVAFKAIKGKNDQGGGLVWRYKDANNYYICRMNPLEDNFRVYKVQDGKRSQFASADVKVPAGEWHRMKVEQKGEHIECYLDSKMYLDVKDDTFKGAGKIGLWSKADAQSYFDDLTVEYEEE
jgi:hypothetical protein